VEELRNAGKGYSENQEVSATRSGRDQAEQLPQEGTGDFKLDATSLSGADTEDRGQDQRTLFVEPETSEQPSSPSAPVLAPTVRRRYKATKIIRRQESRLPNYSPHLPPLDFRKSGKAFYSDLRDKRIIPDYDEDRFLCWCHVAKRAMGRRLGVIALHGLSHCATTEDEGSDVGRYLPSKWISHAAKCGFYKASFLNRQYILSSYYCRTPGRLQNRMGRASEIFRNVHCLDRSHNRKLWPEKAMKNPLPLTLPVEKRGGGLRISSKIKSWTTTLVR
jgi:hypothetical protein